MAISYSQTVDIRGQAVEPVITEILFENKTVSDKLVSFETDIKAGTIFTETNQTVTMQAWTVNPSSAGAMTPSDVIITPVKLEYFQTYDTNDLRSSRFNRSMKPGAWNTISDEFTKYVINGVAGYIGADVENKFWNNALAATKTAVAALSPGTANNQVSTQEQALVAATTAGLFDGIVTRLIYNNGGVGSRIKVAGATITSSNIATEYARHYALIPDETLFAESGEKAYWYAPRSHRKLINILNKAQTYRDIFTVDIAADKYYYLDIEIKFVPLPANTMIVALPSMLKWCTDLMEDMNNVVVDAMPKPRKDYYYDVVFTLFAHVVNQRFITLYVG